jgi:hypothetical protein
MQVDISSTRRAIGSIIGGVFILLILVMGFTFYLLSNRGVSAQQQIFSEMQSYDIDRAQEKIVLYESVHIEDWTSDHIQINIQNRGPKLVNIIKIGLWNGTKWFYYPDFKVNQESIFVTTTSESIASSRNETFRVEGIRATFNVGGIITVDGTAPANGATVYFSEVAAPLYSNIGYYVCESTSEGHTFKVATTLGGEPVNIVFSSVGAYHSTPITLTSNSKLQLLTDRGTVFEAYYLESATG